MQTSSDIAAAPSITARGLGKTYQLGEFADAQRFLTSMVARITAGEPIVRHQPFPALDDVSFETRPGDCLGILGTNGSGKSTLVQVISGITVPTEGEVEVTGRVLPLLEVGSVFHEELTGLENVELFGTVLGLTRDEIRAALPAVSEFGGIEDEHMHTPLKRYSLGMRARLSFATAMRFPAEIYVFDEVMAVVDDHFRALAVREIRRLIAEQRTVLFISHDLELVRRVANKALWLERGRIRMTGSVDEVADAYHLAQLEGLTDDEAVILEEAEH